jgi:general secretion pathway protein C
MAALQVLKRGLRMRPALADRSQLAALGATLVMAVLVAQAAARLTWQLPGLRDSDSSAPAPAVAERAVSRGQPADLRALVEAHWFGRSEAAAPAPALAYDAPETTLDLVLRGIMFTEIAEDSRAILSTESGPHVAYAIGAEVPGGARLEAMYVDRVILSRNGRFETLFLTKDQQGRPVQRAPRSRSQTPKFVIDKRSDASVSSLLSYVRTTVLTNPGTVSNFFRIEPHGTESDFVGFRITSGPGDPQLLNKVGLQSGDVITSINGTALDSPLSGVEALRDLAKARELSVTVLRGEDLIDVKARIQ